MQTLLTVFIVVVALEVSLIITLTLLPRLGGQGKDLLEACTKAPWLDILLSVMLWIPWVIAGLIADWWGVLTAVITQIAIANIWSFSHELAHRETGKPRINRFYNRKLGWWRNHLALWVTAIVIPVFFLIRFAEIFVYPFLIWLLNFPQYQHSEWINVSRQKFQGLVGYDLIWCLYCDWMTGVYALGAEMLRNVESFWCPIRFYDGKKCENCKIDFPDIEGGWIGADGTMDDVAQLIENKYSQEKRSWFGHPERKNI